MPLVKTLNCFIVNYIFNQFDILLSLDSLLKTSLKTCKTEGLSVKKFAWAFNETFRHETMKWDNETMKQHQLQHGTECNKSNIWQILQEH